MEKSCICNNMCYSEGTEDEIINVDESTDFGCTCYNTSYSGNLEAHSRPLSGEEIKSIISQKKVDIPLKEEMIRMSPTEGMDLMRKLISSIDRLEEVSKALLEVVKKK